MSVSPSSFIPITHHSSSPKTYLLSHSLLNYPVKTVKPIALICKVANWNSKLCLSVRVVHYFYVQHITALNIKPRP